MSTCFVLGTCKTQGKEERCDKLLVYVENKMNVVKCDKFIVYVENEMNLVKNAYLRWLNSN